MGFFFPSKLLYSSTPLNDGTGMMRSIFSCVSRENRTWSHVPESLELILLRNGQRCSLYLIIQFKDFILGEEIMDKVLVDKELLNNVV